MEMEMEIKVVNGVREMEMGREMSMGMEMDESMND
jgi:hypothetical protein